MKISKKAKHEEKTESGGHKKSEEHKKPHKKVKKKHHKPVHKKKKPTNLYTAIFGIVIIILAIVVVLFLLNKSITPEVSVSDEDKVKVEFYVMSQCPYGTQVEEGIYPVLENIGNAIDFHLDYIVTEPSPGQFQSLHGEKEVKGNIVQLCAKSYYPEDYKYMDFIICQNKDVSNVDTNWEACALENNMDVEKLRNCLESDEGKELLRTSMQKAMAREARGSPTIYVNDAPYQGQRDSLSFQRAICNEVEHEACASIPECAGDADCTQEKGMVGVCNNPAQSDAYCTYEEPVRVDYIILTAADCKGTACDTTRIVQTSQQLFLGAKPRPVDVNSEEGKALLEEHDIEVVPAYIFDKSVEQTKNWKSRTDLKTAFEKTGDKYKLKDEVTGATHFVDEESRTVYYDAIGVTLGDNKPQIDFFVMSYCPYGNQAEEGIEPVYQLLKDKAEFNPRYVIYSNYRGGGSDYCIDGDNLCSMHGIQELNQNVREACVNKYIGIGEWFEFALAMNKACNSQNADTCWEPVAKGLGLDVEKIKKCEDEEAVELMRADKSTGDKLSVRGSPSIFIEGESYSGARTPEGYKQALCAAFDEPPAECSTKLEGEAQASATQAAPQAQC